MLENYALVGKIIATFGIKGEVKVVSETSFSNKRFKKNSVLLINKNGNLIEATVKGHRVHKNLDLVSFSKVGALELHDNINEILDFVGCELYIEKSKREKLDNDEYYYDELIGLECFDDETEDYIGEVVDIREVPQGIILEIEKEDSTIALVPFVSAFIKEINIEDNSLYIEVIEGLIWDLIS